MANIFFRKSVLSTIFIGIFISLSFSAKGHQWTAPVCEFAAERYAPITKRMNDSLQDIYGNSQPKSEKRKSLIAQYNAHWDDQLSLIYEQQKRVNKRLLQEGSDPNFIAFNDAINSNVSMMTKIVVVENPNSSEATYRRLIEDRCNLIGIK